MFVLRVLALGLLLQCVVGDSPLEKLIRDKKTYVKHADPGNTTVLVGLSYLCGEYHRHTHTLTSRVFERYAWTDSRLAWNPKDYSGLKKANVPLELVWTPEIRLFNAFEHTEERDSQSVVLFWNGTVFWFPSATYTTLCHTEKHDEHKAYECEIQLSSWTKDTSELPMGLFEGGFDIEHYFDDCPYVVTEHSVKILNKKYDCCPEPFPSLFVHVELVHRSHEDEEREHEEKEKKGRWEQYKIKKPCFWPYC